MVLVTLADSGSTATLSSGAVTGPLTFCADSINAGGIDYSNGSLVIQGTAIHHTSAAGPVHSYVWPYVVPIQVALAWITARQR